MIKFTMVRSPSPYNVILGRTGLRELRAVPSTIHAMMKFPTPGGIATLSTKRAVVMECRRLEERQDPRNNFSPEYEVETMSRGTQGLGPTEDILVNATYPEQRVTIGTGFSRECRRQLIELLRKNKEVFAWEPTDMTGVPRRFIQHSLNVNVSDTPIAQKRRIFSREKNQVITREVKEWIKAGIVRPVRYPTWISNRCL